MTTRQQLEQQLVAAHRTGNVQAAQQAAYAIRAYDQNVLSAQVPSINAPPPIERVPKPTFGSWLENVGIGIGEGLGEQVQGIGDLAQRGVSALGAYAKDPLKASAAAFMGALAPAMRGFTQPVQTAKDVGTGLVETGKQMYQQATSGPVGLGTVIGQNIDIMPGPSLPGGKRRPTMAELDVYHGTPHTFEPEEGAPLGRFRSSKIGTGEGNQSYGYGLYLAEEPNVAKQYASGGGGFISTQGKDNIYFNGKWIQDFSDKKSAEGLAKYSMSQSAAGITVPEKIETLKKLGRQDAAEWLEKNQNKFSVSQGSLYKVDLPDAKIEQMLDWDKPLSEQSENVRNALKRRITDVQPIDKFDMGGGSRLRDNRMGQYDKTKPYPWILEANSGNGTSAFGLNQKDVDRMFGGKDASSLTGEQIISRLAVTQGSQAAASEYLRSLGIPGIKYLDAGSRGNFQVQNKYKGQNYGEAVSFKTEQQAKDYAAEQVAKGFEADIQSGTRNFVVFPGEEQHLNILERN